MRSVIWISFAALLLICGTSCPQAKPGSGSAGGAGAGNAAEVSAASQTPGSSATEIKLPPTPPAPAGAQSVWLTTSDGWHVAAWFWPARKVKGDAKSPALILLHQRGKDKSSWGGLPDKLAVEGYAVIAIDLRGHGQTVNPQNQPIALNSLGDADYQAMLFDVAAAHTFLAQQKGVDGARVGLIGASIGANLGLLYAANDRRVRTVVALSPGLDYKSLKPLPSMLALDKRPLFLIASKGDAYSYDTIQQLQAAAVKEAPVSVRAYDGKAHGTELFGAVEGLDDTIVTGWLMNYLSPAAPPVT